MAEKTLSIWEHLDELRKRLTLSILVTVILGAVCYIYWGPILNFLIRPAGDRQLIYLNVMEPFVARFKMASWGGFILAFPYILFQIMAFIIPALSKKEKRFIILMIIFALVLFFGGIYVGYTYVLGVGIKWLESQGAGLLRASLTVSEYISFVGLFLLAFGVSFETPVVVVVLARLGVVRPITLIKQWRLVITIILFVSAIITPDWSPVTMAMMAVPMLGLYIVGVGLSFIFAPRKKFQELGSES